MRPTSWNRNSGRCTPIRISEFDHAAARTSAIGVSGWTCDSAIVATWRARKLRRRSAGTGTRSSYHGAPAGAATRGDPPDRGIGSAGGRERFAVASEAMNLYDATVPVFTKLLSNVDKW